MLIIHILLILNNNFISIMQIIYSILLLLAGGYFDNVKKTDTADAIMKTL